MDGPVHPPKASLRLELGFVNSQTSRGAIPGAVDFGLSAWQAMTAAM
jgi:hypothetical protein